MTNQEKVALMKGSAEDKQRLFEMLIEKALINELDDSEVPMLEFLKKELLPKQSQVVQMAATMKGVGGLS